MGEAGKSRFTQATNQGGGAKVSQWRPPITLLRARLSRRLVPLQQSQSCNYRVFDSRVAITVETSLMRSFASLEDPLSTLPV